MPARSFLSQLRRPRGSARAWLGVVLALALALRLLVPQGWMPGPAGLMPCPEAGPVMSMAHGVKHHAPGKETRHQPCAFAGLGLAAAAPAAVPAVLAPAPPAIVTAGLRQQAAPGRGLAAPPPPPTGPPAFA